jgi:GTP-binding protein Era
MKHQSGFVNIIGKPNVGKSTLMNALLGEKLSIATSKAQTTRHRILGIINEPAYQIIFSDTPGLLDPAYKMQERMMNFVESAFVDADVMILLTEGEEPLDERLVERLNKLEVPLMVVLNKVDLRDQEIVQNKLTELEQRFPQAAVIPVSALHGFNLQAVLDQILEWLPEAPPYYDKESLSDRPVRFFISEMIREQILMRYQREIPYSCEVEIEEYTEEEELVRIRALIYVMRKSQKGILIGHKGEMLKKVGTGARKAIEEFIGKKVFLELYVKVDENWRDHDRKLDKFGYR